MLCTSLASFNRPPCRISSTRRPLSKGLSPPSMPSVGACRLPFAKMMPSSRSQEIIQHPRSSYSYNQYHRDQHQTRNRGFYLPPNKFSSHPISPFPSLPPFSVPTSGRSGAGSIVSLSLLLSRVSGLDELSSTASKVLSLLSMNIPLFLLNHPLDFFLLKSGRG